MGGTVVVRACPTLQEIGFRIAGVIVLDVVEGKFCFLRTESRT